MGLCVTAACGVSWREQKACEVQEAWFNVTQPICFQSAKVAGELHGVPAGKGVMLLDTPEFMVKRNSFWLVLI